MPRCAFPSFPGFGGGVFQRAKDKELALGCVRAWNDFQLDEWCATAPERLIPLGILPHLGSEPGRRRGRAGGCAWAPARCRSRIARYRLDCRPSITRRTGRCCGTPWRLPTCRCACTSARARIVPGFAPHTKQWPEDTAPFAVAIATFSTNLMWSTADLVFSGMLQRHPNLKFMLSEGGIGWIPYLLERSTTPGNGTGGIRTSARPTALGPIPPTHLGMLHR